METCGTHSTANSEQTSVWSWGAGGHGQLGSGAFDDAWEPLQLPLLITEADSSPRVLHMACGGAHAVAVVGSEDHAKVLTWGNGHSGALGHGDESDLSVPMLVKYFQGIQIVSVAAGWSHTAFVASSGELYTCGNGSFGQLGHGNLDSCLIPSKVLTLPCKTVSMAACGMRHTLILAHGTNERATVFAFGSSKRGQLGIGTLRSNLKNEKHIKNNGKVSIPQEVTALRDQQIVLLAANGDHSAALSDTGDLFLWGRGFDGRPDGPVPAKVRFRLRFSQVAIGWNHLVAIADGQLWALGSNDRGQLGILKAVEAKSESVILKSTPSKNSMQVLLPVSDSYVNHSDGVLPIQSHHGSVSVATSDGYDMGARLQVDSCIPEDHSHELVRVAGMEGKVVTCLSVGAEHSAIVTDNGVIMTWGWGEHGQLGLRTEEDQFQPKAVSINFHLSEGKSKWQIFCGSGFTVAVAEQLVQA